MNFDDVTLDMVLTESLFGLAVMGLVVIVNIYSFGWISVAYRRAIKNAVFHGVHFEIIRLSVYIMMLVSAMLISLLIWVLAFNVFEFIPDWRKGLLFTASFFTSVGNFPVSFPYGWKLIPSIVAFSGLFSFAWATAVSMGMCKQFSDFIDKHH